MSDVLSTPALNLLPVPLQSIFAEAGYFVWCATLVRDEAGLCHLFYSRWPERFGFNGWVTHSEVAHAVSDSPLGPYHFVDVALPERGSDFWDGHCTHNPTIQRFGDRYYLYYMGNRGNSAPGHEFNWSHRNAQRIGVAIADSPYGPWERPTSPLIDVTPGFYDALCCANPTVTQRPEGDFLMIYKGVADQNTLPFGGPVTHIVATAPTPTGPFTKHPSPIFESERSSFAAEDPYLWQQDGRYFAIVKDMGGFFTGAGTSLALMTSPDGFSWQATETPLISRREYRDFNGVVHQVQRLERPQLWLEQGQPTVLFCAVAEDHEHLKPTYNIAIPLSP